VTVAALLLVKDEADVLPSTLGWLHDQVDEIYVADNMSSDGSYEIAVASGAKVQLDREVGYFQARKMTRMARKAWEDGHSWVIPCDAEELWYSPDGRPLRDVLAGMPFDVLIHSAEILNFIPTVLDPSVEEEPDPVKRIQWRLRAPAPLPKVCARTDEHLVIHAGNHSAAIGKWGKATPGLALRHYTWRSPEQYLRKIRNGVAAYQATDLPEEIGAHWRMWAGQPDEAILEHYGRWFSNHDPRTNDDLFHDPLPVEEPV
jgi:hypothetical protein